MISELDYYYQTFKNYVFQFLGDLECLPMYHFHCKDGFNVLIQEKYSRKHKFHQRAHFQFRLTKESDYYRFTIIVKLVDSEKKYINSSVFKSPIDVSLSDEDIEEFKKWVVENAVVGNFVNEMKKI